jgi:sugar phosphate isomerase/epimerase
MSLRRLMLVVPFACLCATVPARTQRAAPAAPPLHIQVGWCIGLKDVLNAKAAGFEYVELGTTEIAALSDEAFEAAAASIKQSGLAVPVTNLFLPGTLKVTGPQIDIGQQMAYIRRAFDRLARLGTQIVVFGSGGARRFPDGFDKRDAFDQLVDFGKRIAPEARARGITVAIEPLRRQETNIINSAAEGLALVKAIDDPNFQLMIDFYHLASEQEDPGIVLDAKDYIRHLHMANPRGRVFPVRSDEFDYAPFFANLRKIGYNRRISVEASTKDLPADAPLAIALLRLAFRPPEDPASRVTALSESGILCGTPASAGGRRPCR